MQVVRYLADELGPRPAGGESERRAAEYVARTLTDGGLEAQTHAFLFRGWRASQGAELSFRDEQGSVSRLTGVQLPYTGATAPEGESGRLTWQGTWAMIPGRLLCPRFLVIGTDGQPKAALVATPMGAARLLPNPLPLLVLPTICVSEDDGLRLACLARSSADAPIVNVTCPPAWEGPLRSQNIIATVGRTDRVLALTAHYDSVDGSPGANDNASGVSLLLRLARRLRRSPETRVGFRLAFYGAEEPLFVGSRSDVTDLATSCELPRILGCLNFDMMGVGGEFNVRCPSSSVWARAARGIGAGSSGGVRIHPVPEAAASDHWAFHEAGVDSAQLTRTPDLAYHSSADVSGRFKAEDLDSAESVAWALLRAAVNELAQAPPRA